MSKNTDEKDALEEPTEIGRRLLDLARARGVSQNKLGEKAGIESGPMSKLIYRPNPSLSKMGAIASAWGVRLDWLATETGPRDSDPDEALVAGLPTEQAIAVRWARDAGATKEELSEIARPDKKKRDARDWIAVAQGVMARGPTPLPEGEVVKPADVPVPKRKKRKE